MLDLLKDNYISVHYHLGKANVVADALSRVSMESVAHVDNKKKDSAREVYELSRLGVRLNEVKNGGVIDLDGYKSSLVGEIKTIQDLEW